MNFYLNDKETAAAAEWTRKHNKTCKIPEGAIGGKFTYSFTPNSIGTGVSISCACGASENCTDYSDW